jgi:hypothetical protein
MRNSDDNTKDELKRAHVEIKVLKADLKWEDEMKPGEATREGMLRRFQALAREV